MVVWMVLVEKGKGKVGAWGHLSTFFLFSRSSVAVLSSVLMMSSCKGILVRVVIFVKYINIYICYFVKKTLIECSQKYVKNIIKIKIYSYHIHLCHNSFISENDACIVCVHKFFLQLFFYPTLACFSYIL